MTSDNQRDPGLGARPDASATPRRAGASSGLRWGITAFLALVALIAIAALVAEVTILRPRYDQATSEQQAQSEVVRSAERFTVQANTYTATSMDSYQRSMDTMMSPKFQADYKKVIDQLASTIQQAKITSKGEILSSAVASLDSDSAQVLVASDADVKTVYDPSLARHFRWEVSLVKINGKWLVDDFTPVA